MTTWVTQKCSDCDAEGFTNDTGNGKCSACHGTGMDLDPMERGGPGSCETCGGSGKCQTCRGEGVVSD